MRWLVVLAIGCGGGASAAPDAAPMIDGAPDAAAAPTAAELLAKIATCSKVGGDYATDSGGTSTIPICGLSSAVFWKADMDIDCDGGSSALCMSDPYYQPDTSGVTRLQVYTPLR